MLGSRFQVCSFIGGDNDKDHLWVSKYLHPPRLMQEKYLACNARRKSFMDIFLLEEEPRDKTLAIACLAL
jgi:hypothetical protein